MAPAAEADGVAGGVAGVVGVAGATGATGDAGGVGGVGGAIDFWLMSQAAISATALAGNAVA